MYSFLQKRLLYMLVTLILVSIIGFIIINLPPGSFLDFYMGELEAQGTETSLEQIRHLERRYNLNDPVFIQYFRWISGFIKGDFGQSFLYNRPVGEMIFSRLGYTVLISSLTLLFTWLIALPIGIYSAVNKHTAGDNIFTFIGFLGLSIPNFLLALIFMVIAALVFNQSVGGLFSEAYRDAGWSIGKLLDLLKHLWIPVIVVGTAGTASLIRIMRGNLLDILNQQYIVTARAKGLSERIVIYKHAVKNSLHPLIMQLGMSFPTIISGTTVVAIVLSLPTIGPLYYRALNAQDMFLAGTLLMFMSIMLVIGNLLADIMLMLIDPRIRYD